jgi:hypothetical protein
MTGIRTTVSQLTWNPWRDHMILEYEIMKFDGDLGRPNLLPLSKDLRQDKIGGLLKVFLPERCYERHLPQH